jgi:hypothetical protein
VSASTGGMQDVETQLLRWRHDGGLTFLAIDTAPGSAKALGRPQVGPREVRERFMRFIGALTKGHQADSSGRAQHSPVLPSERGTGGA